MKWFRFLLLVLLVSLFIPQTQTSHAQDNGIITLNDDMPSINVIVDAPPNTTGVVYLEVRGATVTVTDAAGTTIFQMADDRIYAVELRFAPTDQRHTIKVERLADYPVAYVMVKAQTQLRDFGPTSVTEGTVLMLQQSTELDLSDDMPGATLSLLSPENYVINLGVEFPREQLTGQIIDSAGLPLVTLYDGGIDGFNLIMRSGTYQLSLLRSGWDTTVETTINLALAAGYTLPAGG